MRRWVLQKAHGNAWVSRFFNFIFHDCFEAPLCTVDNAIMWSLWWYWKLLFSIPPGIESWLKFQFSLKCQFYKYNLSIFFGVQLMVCLYPLWWYYCNLYLGPSEDNFVNIVHLFMGSYTQMFFVGNCHVDNSCIHKICDISSVALKHWWDRYQIPHSHNMYHILHLRFSFSLGICVNSFLENGGTVVVDAILTDWYSNTLSVLVFK